MSKMNRALILALIPGVAIATTPEWKGIFLTPENTYKWGAQKVSGSYVDPAMYLVALPVATASSAVLTSVTPNGTHAMTLTCEDVTGGGVITPMFDKCYNLVFTQSASETIFDVNTTGVAAVAFFGQHLPTEFEDTDHYFKDTSSVDIEPVAQDPEGAHSHGGGSTTDPYAGQCVCQAQTHGWTLDCTNVAYIQAAVDTLENNTNCKATGASAIDVCDDNFHVMQAHHDHCLHHQLPQGIENILHDYEQYYTSCFIKRQYDANLNVCPAVTCSDQTALTNAVQTLNAGCSTTSTCAGTACSAAIKLVLMAHDTCAEADLPTGLETALHSFEDPCAAELCNTAPAAFNAYDQQCQALSETNAASGFGGLEAFLVKALALPLAVLISS